MTAPTLLLLLLLPLLTRAQTPPTCPTAFPHQSPAPETPTLSPASVSRFMVSLTIPAQRRQFPDGTMLDDDPTFHCTAILLSSRWLAAPPACHDPDFGIIAHVTASTRFSGARLAIEKWLPASLNATAPPHVVFAKLAADAPPNATFARVNDNPALPEPGSYVRAVSFGVPKAGDPPAVADALPLRQVEARVIETERCPDELGAVDVCEQQICAGWGVSGAGCNACVMGDDQALLSFDEDGNPIVLGMGAEDRGRCGNIGLVTTFLRTERYLGYMREQGVEFTPAGNAVSVFERPGESPLPSEGGPAEPNDAGEAVPGESKDDGGVPLGAAIGAPVALLVAVVVVVVIVRVVRR